ncbi:MAG: hypothetical protein F4Y27_10450 [Acidimicrobiaceae bacterium]|nr:hypothetical protein [Acidimicrobiaceae bacterium]MYG55490.1 hypothetical protein [Acidimicrobiaceae bacterium]MYJ99291.1 hypothetical protein [Acidimicrobiaceae bacterium]
MRPRMGHTKAVSVDWDAVVAAGLYDPASSDADTRRELIELLASYGATIEQMVGAIQIGELWELAIELVYGKTADMSARELAQRVGVGLEVIESIYRVAGVPVKDPDERRFGERDVELVRGLGNVLGGKFFQYEELGEVLRVFGESVGRIADAAVAMYQQGAYQRMMVSEANELERAKLTIDRASDALVFPQLLTALIRHHISDAAERLQATQVQGSPSERLLAVGFVDIVGYSARASEVSMGELFDLVSGFENRSLDIVAASGGHTVKHLGDEVMFVANDAAAAATIAMDLIDAFDNEGDVTPHGGVTFGPVVNRRGDYYGPVVNLASRIARQAVPGEILVSSDMASHLVGVDGFETFPAGRRMLRGFADPVKVHTLIRH